MTNLHSLASSSTFLSGWTSAYIDNTTNKPLNQWVYGQIAAGTTPTAGSVRVYAYAFDGTNTPDLFSSGTEGTEGAATVHDTEQLNASLVLLWSSDVDTTTNDVYTMPPRSVLSIFGFVPKKWALYISHDTVAALRSSVNAFWVDESYQSYT